MSAKRLLLILICVVAIIIALSFQVSHFQYVRSEVDAPIVVKDSPASILFIGDVMLGRNVELLMNQKGTDYPFVFVDSLLTSTDAVVANLEGPIMQTSVPTPSGSLHFSFSSTTPKILAQHHIGIVNLANNHTFDYGGKGYAETASLLDAQGIVHFGHPFAFGEKYVVHQTIAGRKFIFVGFNATNPTFDTEGATHFIQNLPHDHETLVVEIHGGTEYNLHSSAFQQKLYRGFIDAGADLIIAHHPHVVEEIEQYKNKLIFYSLGNFIFDQYFSKDVEQMLAVQATFTDSTMSFKLIPLKSVRSQPMLMNEQEKNTWLANLALRSDQKIAADIKKGELTLIK